MTLRKRIAASTQDREAPEVEPLIVEQLGPRQALTPEGFLLCEEVPIARIGVMIYGPGEVPVEVGPDGLARVRRSEEDLFSDVAMASFVGKPVVDEHPSEDVTPKNWRELAKGFALRVWRGEGADSEVLLSDLIITDPEMIRDIQAGKREVSCGYDANYEDLGNGEGKQTDIVGNHIALVERGRCGPRCAIGDQELKQPKGTKMPQANPAGAKRRATISAAVRKTFRDAEAAALEALEEGAPVDDALEDGNGSTTGESHTHIHIHGPGGSSAAATDADDPGPGAGAGGEGGEEDPTEKRFKTIETALAGLTEAVNKLAQPAPTAATGDAGEEEEEDDEGKKTDDEFPPKKDGEGEGKGKTNDSAALETSYKEVLALAEVLVPGFRMPTFDAKANRKATVDSMCAARRKALDITYATVDGKELVESVAGSKTLDMAAMSCAGIAGLFRSAAGAKKLLNNRLSTGDAGTLARPAQGEKKAPVSSIAELNKANREFHQARATKV